MSLIHLIQRSPIPIPDQYLCSSAKDQSYVTELNHSLDTLVFARHKLKCISVWSEMTNTGILDDLRTLSTLVYDHIVEFNLTI